MWYELESLLYGLLALAAVSGLVWVLNRIKKKVLSQIKRTGCK